MPPVSQSTLDFLRLNNNIFLAAITAVIYDYVLNFSREVDYIWCRPWSWVSTLFVLVRYLGLSWVMLNGLSGTAFLRGPVEMYALRFEASCILNDSIGTTIYLVAVWQYPIFVAAADLMMILRVYAMWDQSKKILCILVFLFVSQIMVSFIFTGIFTNPDTHFSATIIKIVNISICHYSFNNVPSIMRLYDAIPRFFLSSALLTLALAQTLKQSIEMYKVTKRWQPNRYLQQLGRDGVLYFIVNLNALSTLALAWLGMSHAVHGTFILFLDLLCFITLCPMMPRFIIDVREMYDRDTGFGVPSQLAVGESVSTASSVAFGNAVSGEGQTTLAAKGDTNHAIKSEAVRGVGGWYGPGLTRSRKDRAVECSFCV